MKPETTTIRPFRKTDAPALLGLTKFVKDHLDYRADKQLIKKLLHTHKGQRR